MSINSDVARYVCDCAVALSWE